MRAAKTVVEVIGFTRPDMPKQVRRLIKQGDIPAKLALTMGVCMTPCSIRDSGRLGDPQNSAPPMHRVPELLRAIQGEGFRSVIVFDLRRSRVGEVGMHLQTGLLYVQQARACNVLQFLNTASQQEEVDFMEPFLARGYPGLTIRPCPQEGPTCIFRKAVDPNRTTGEICLFRLSRLLRSLPQAA